MDKYANRKELVDLFQNKNLIGRGVEVGSYKGEYASEILKRWHGDLYLVDVWEELDPKEYEDLSNDTSPKKIYTECIENTKEYTGRCFMLRLRSEKAVELFPDESLDFVYIDANHKYEYARRDIAIWHPKVRKGGIIAGHDYVCNFDWYKDKNFALNQKDKHIYLNTGEYAGLFGVNPAIDEFAKEENYEVNVTDEPFASWHIEKNKTLA